ncbi:META domain-containing protein [Candidatus Uabimicrobium sp. HlEnr_7]|uniref:META domain-containing protein n=1 Tax=Candidatus Uabimicrobium helgolandensis TaxID=3095367 RepID=UPI0035574003
MKLRIISIIFSFVILIACNDESSGANAKSDPPKTDTSKMNTSTNPLKRAQAAKWVLQSMKYKGLVLKLVKGSKITFTCDASGAVTGKSTVNTYSGVLQVDQNGAMLWLDSGISHTEMASISNNADQLHRQEDAFIKTIRDTSQMVVKDGLLIIKNKDGSTELKFVKAS